MEKQRTKLRGRKADVQTQCEGRNVLKKNEKYMGGLRQEATYSLREEGLNEVKVEAVRGACSWRRFTPYGNVGADSGRKGGIWGLSG